MTRLLMAFLLVLLIACSGSRSAEPVQPIYFPQEWSFLRSEPVSEIHNATPNYVSATVTGDVASNLDPAVDEATKSGWTEVSRSEVISGLAVTLSHQDGSLLRITVVPEDGAINLSAVRVPPK